MSTKSLRCFEKLRRANKLSYPYAVCCRLQGNSGSFFCRQQMTWWPEDSYQECDLGYSSGHAPQNMVRARISSGRSPCYQGSLHRGLLKSVKNFQGFTVICRKPHVASSICLRPTIFQNPEGTLWTHCTFHGSSGDVQEFCKYILFIIKLLNTILIILIAFLLFSSLSLYVIGTDSIFTVNQIIFFHYCV